MNAADLSQANYGCPRHNIALVEMKTGDIHRWQCAVCSGVWLPAGAFHARVGHVSVAGRGRPAGFSCPNDGHGLTAVIHRGIEVDVCGTCGGVWFDQGELQKILSKAATPARNFIDGSPGSSIPDLAVRTVDCLGGADLAGEVAQAIFEFLGGLAP